MEIFPRWRRRILNLVEGISSLREAKIFFGSIKFSGGEQLTLADNSILVIVGPNNAGKSSALRELRDYIQDNRGVGPVLSSVEVRVTGSVDKFKNHIAAAGLPTDRHDLIRVGRYEYEIGRVNEEYLSGFIGSRVIPFFVSYLGAEERLKLADPSDRREYSDNAPKTPMQWLELDDQAQERISEIFEKTFDSKLLLNTLAGNKLMLNLLRPQDERTEFASTRDYAGWLATLPTLHGQGDGMRSFTGTLMSLLVHPTSIILLDEPEAFLHPPQARRLAEIITSDVPGNCQVIVATHDDSFIRALLDASGKRVILARIVRVGSKNKASILDQRKLTEMWNDSLLRTSDVLSALFHEAAILCEGDSDARFYSALLDATKGERRDADVSFYHFGGKDRIASVARALRAVQIPVVVIVDIDILSDQEKFLQLFETLGGRRDLVEHDVTNLNRSVGTRKGQLTGRELAVELRRIAHDCEGRVDIPNSVRNGLQACLSG
jgi:ABC-type Mn2+/Zn2+ transport system ATPase subunit